MKGFKKKGFGKGETPLRTQQQRSGWEEYIFTEMAKKKHF